MTFVSDTAKQVIQNTSLHWRHFGNYLCLFFMIPEIAT